MGQERASKYSSTLQRKDGRPLTVLVDAVVGRFNGRKATIGALVDIGERIQAEERIREVEDKFRSLVQQNIAGIVILREDSTVAYCNACFAQMIGYSPEYIIGRSALEFLPETEQPLIQSVRSQLAETGASVQVASAVRARDGRIVSVLANTSKSTFEGRPASIAVIVDVTERNAAQRKLESTAAILAAEHEASPDGILVVDPRARIVSVNRRFGQIFKLPTEAARRQAMTSGCWRWRRKPWRTTEAFMRRVRTIYEHIDTSSRDEFVLKDGP